MRRAVEWLAEPWEGQLPFDFEDMRGDRPTVPPNADGSPITRGQVMAALVGWNAGQLQVRGYGAVTSGPDCGPYRRVGLEQRSASALTQMGSFLAGVIMATGDIWDPVWAMFNAEWDRVEAVRAAR